MEDADGESVGCSSAVDSHSVAIDASTSICASEDSIEVSTTYEHADVSAVSLYRGTFNVDDASSASSEAASAASASTTTSVHKNKDQSLTALPLISIKEVTTPAPVDGPGGKSAVADQKKPSPTSVDMFDLFLAEADQAEVQEEEDGNENEHARSGGVDLSPARVARDLAQHRLNVYKLERNDAKYAGDLKLMERGVRRVENLQQLQQECVSFAAAATALGSDPDTTGAPASRLVDIIRQKECLLIRLAARLSGVTRKLAKKERDVQKLKAALDTMRERVRSSTKSDHKHIEDIAALAGRLREMELELSDKEALVTRLFDELATSKREYEEVIIDLRAAHDDELQKYVNKKSGLEHTIQQLGGYASGEEDSVADYNSAHPSVNVKETDLSDEIECVFVARNTPSVQSPSLANADSFATAEQEQSLRTAGSFATAEQSLLRSVVGSEKGDTLALKVEIDELKERIAQMEEDISSKDRELSGVRRVLFPGEESDEEEPESVQVVEHAARLAEDLETAKSTNEATQRELDLAKQGLTRLRDRLQKAEEELVERNVEISGVKSLLEDNSCLLNDDPIPSNEETSETRALPIFDRALQLVTELSSERDRCESARNKVLKLEDDVEKLNANLSRLNELEVELGEKDNIITSLTEELRQSQERADNEVSALKQLAIDESLRHQGEIDAARNDMMIRIEELETKHAKVCEELEARITQRDQKIEKIRSSTSTWVKREAMESQNLEVAAPAQESQSIEALQHEIKVLREESSDQQRQYVARIAEVESNADARIKELQQVNDEVCQKLQGALEVDNRRSISLSAKEDSDVSLGNDAFASLQDEKSRLECDLHSAQAKANADIAELQAAMDQERKQHETRIQELEQSLSSLKEEKDAATSGLEATIATLERHKSTLFEEIERRKKMLANGEDIAESSQKKAEDEIRRLTASTKALEERYRALKGDGVCVGGSVDMPKDIQYADPLQILELSRERDELSEELQQLRGAMEEAKSKFEVNTEEQLLRHQNAIAELEEKIDHLLAEKIASEQTYVNAIAALKATLAKSLKDSVSASADANAKLDQAHSTTVKLEEDVASLRLENERLESKMKDVLATKDRKIAEAWKTVEDKRIVIVSLESEKKTMKVKIRDLERELKMSRARSQGQVLALQTEVEKLRSALADAKRELSSMEAEKQNEIDSLRDFYESKINELEEDKNKLSSQLYDLHVSIVGTLKAVAPGEPSTSENKSPDLPEDDGRDRLAVLQAQKELTIKEVRMEMQSALDLKEQELEALRYENSVGTERIKSLELLLEMKEGELVDVKRALAEKSFLEESAAYDESFSDDETLIASPTRTPRKDGGKVEEIPEERQATGTSTLPLASKSADTTRRPTTAYRAIVAFGKMLTFVFIRLPIKVATLGLLLFLACIAMLWVGAALVVAWSFLADDNGAAKIGAGISYGNSFASGINNI